MEAGEKIVSLIPIRQQWRMMAIRAVGTALEMINLSRKWPECSGNSVARARRRRMALFNSQFRINSTQQRAMLNTNTLSRAVIAFVHRYTSAKIPIKIWTEPLNPDNFAGRDLWKEIKQKMSHERGRISECVWENARKLYVKTWGRWIWKRGEDGCEKRGECMWKREEYRM